MNKVILIGRLTRDPELRYTGSNIAVATFTLAVNRPFTGPNGERETDFINIVVWRKQAENVKNYISQGSQVAVEGRIQTRSYDDQNGQKRYVTEVVADNVQFLETKASREQRDTNGYNQNYPSSYNQNTNYQQELNPYDFTNNVDVPLTNINQDPFKDFGEEIKVEDDDLPF